LIILSALQPAGNKSLVDVDTGEQLLCSFQQHPLPGSVYAAAFQVQPQRGQWL
jgi:hypothetical protein